VKAPGRPRRLVLVDPCLTGLGSHPYHYAAAVLAAATRAGHEGLLVTHRDFAAAPADWRVLPACTHTAYSKYTLCGGLDRLDDRGRGPWLPDMPWARRHASRRREARIAAFAQDVLPALADLAAGDAVLVATASELEAIGLARAIAAAQPPHGVGWHVQFHFPIFRGFAPDYPRQERRFTAARDALRAATAAAPHALTYHATTEDLAAEYERFVPGPVHVLPYPVQAPASAPRPAHGPIHIACLGDARPEKHSECLAAVVADIAADPALSGRVRFAVQTNRGYPATSRKPEHVAVTQSLAALAHAAAAGAPLDLLEGPLDAETYARELATADVLLLPYDQGRYRSRCSGVVLEALAAGAVPIMTGGGWMARQIAAATEAHATAVVARSRVLATHRRAPPPIGRQPLTIDLTALSTIAGDAAAVAVEIAWEAEDSMRLALPPVRVGVMGGPAGPATVLAAGAGAGVSTAIVPLTAAAGLRLEITPACGADAAAPAAITVRELATDGPVPAAAVGLVIAAPADAPAAIREVVRHAEHYRATAAAHTATYGRTAAADEIVRRLFP
jgi:glycosyltransferase involved in cell wall biosynthesis